MFTPRSSREPAGRPSRSSRTRALKYAPCMIMLTDQAQPPWPPWPWAQLLYRVPHSRSSIGNTYRSHMACMVVSGYSRQLIQYVTSDIHVCTLQPVARARRQQVALEPWPASRRCLCTDLKPIVARHEAKIHAKLFDASQAVSTDRWPAGHACSAGEAGSSRTVNLIHLAIFRISQSDFMLLQDLAFAGLRCSGAMPNGQI